MTSIPARQLVNVRPSVLSVGGSGLAITGLMLTSSTRPPLGTVLTFPDPDSVSDYFGPASEEAELAAVYFQGFTSSAKLPGEIKFAQYNAAAVAGYVRGGDVGALTLSEVQAVDGQFIISVDGEQIIIADLDLSSATSFSNAAALLQTAINAGVGTPDVVVTFDSVSNAFVITSAMTGASSSVGYASGTGTGDTVLRLTSATGAVLSPGGAAATPAAFMTALVAVDATWTTFMTMFDPDVSGHANKAAFAAWKNTQNNRYAYVCWDLDQSPGQSNPAVGSLGQELADDGDSGTCLLDGDAVAGWGADAATKLAAFVCGAAASIDFDETNGRITFAYKQQAGLVATVTSASFATNLGGNPQVGDRGNGYNFYGAYGSASENFVWFQRGLVTGPFAWLDSYLNQVWLNNRFQSDLLNLFATARSVPYSAAGRNLIETALAGTIQAALNFGMIAPGSISSSQAAAVNQAAGASISGSLQTQGYYLQVKDASSAARAARTTPPCKFWYLDRGSVQAIDLASIALQ